MDWNFPKMNKPKGSLNRIMPPNSWIHDKAYRLSSLMKELFNHRIKIAVMFMFAAFLVSCVPLIETDVADMNLTLSDLGAAFEIVADEGLEERKDTFAEEILAEVNDMSYRVFYGPDRIVWSQVISFASPNPTYFHDVAFSNDMNMANWLASPSNDICRQLGKLECNKTIGQHTGMVPWSSIEDVNFGAVDNYTRVGGETDTVQAYVLTFRQVNIVVVLKVVGLLDTLEQSWVEELGRKLESNIK